MGKTNFTLGAISKWLILPCYNGPILPWLDRLKDSLVGGLKANFTAIPIAADMPEALQTKCNPPVSQLMRGWITDDGNCFFWRVKSCFQIRWIHSPQDDHPDWYGVHLLPDLKVDWLLINPNLVALQGVAEQLSTKLITWWLRWVIRIR